MSTGEIRQQDGVDHRFARIMHNLSTTYYGKTNATRQQAQEMGHTGKTLRAMEQCVNKLQDTSHAWQARVALTQCVANCRTIRAEAVTVLSRSHSIQATNPKNSLSCKPIPGTTKMRISIVADQHTARTAIDTARASHDDAAIAFVTVARWMVWGRCR